MYKPFTSFKPGFIAAGLLSGFLCLSRPAQAQTYCTPVVTGTGFYISNIQFSYLSPGTNWNTGNNGYSANTGSSSKTVPRYHGFSNSLWYTISNTTGSNTQVYVHLFADWNQDGDFSDAHEANYIGSVNAVASSTTGTGISFAPSLDAVPGSTRLRIIATTSSTAVNPCAAVTGEVEDYTITISNSTAPVLSTTTAPVLNSQLASQTASEGFTVNQLVTSALPGGTLITDPDDSTSYFVPRGVALTGATASNGSWEYKAGAAGTWTPIGAVSASNALLLLGDGSDTRYQPGTRLRFVPTGSGTPSLSFRAWDGTSGANASYASTAVNGGNTAFSLASATASLSVVAANPTRHFYLGSATADNILTADFDPAGNTAYMPGTVVSANANLTNITDMDLDAVNNRLIWTESSGTADKIVSSGTDGSNVTALYTFPAATSIPNGIATGGGKIYFTDNAVASKGVFRMALNGTGIQQLTGGAGQLATPNQVRDIEFYNDKLYVLTRATSSSVYSIYQMDTNGANPLEVATSSNLIQYLEVAGGMLFWDEVVSGTSTLYSRLISGGSVTALASATGRQYREIHVDTAISRVYYLDYSTASNLPADRALMSAPYGSATGGVVKLLTLPDTYTALVSEAPAAAVGLGVSLLDFSGQALASSNRLQWHVSGEAPQTTYVLERSADNGIFEPVAELAGGSDRYAYEDRNAPAGRSAYRLRMQDAGAEVSYSKTILLQRSGQPGGTVSVYPNPVQQELHVRGATPRLLELFNALGQRVALGAATSNLSLQGLPAGCYNLRITLEGQTGVLNHRLIKQ